MEFLCPSCQKMLTVPEQFAGQPMKCPLCGNTFQAPSLPPEAAKGSPSAATEPFTYSVAPEPESSPIPTPPSAPKPKPAPPSPPPPPSPTEEPSTAPVYMAGEYARRFTLTIRPQFLPYVPAGALVVVFFLTFFSWVGSYPNSTPQFTQNAWQAAFSGFSDPFELIDAEAKDKFSPGVSFLVLLWLLIFLPLLALAVGVVVVPRLRAKMPPVITAYWPWRMVILGGVSILLMLLMIMVDLARFPLEVKLISKAKDTAKAQSGGGKIHDLIESQEISKLGLQHTNVFRFVFLMLLVTLVCAALDFWLEERGPSKPMPRMDLLW